MQQFKVIIAYETSAGFFLNLAEAERNRAEVDWELESVHKVALLRVADIYDTHYYLLENVTMDVNDGQKIRS